MTTALLAHPLSAEDAQRLGLAAREYRVNEQITIDSALAAELRIRGILQPELAVAPVTLSLEDQVRAIVAAMITQYLADGTLSGAGGGGGAVSPTLAHAVRFIRYDTTGLVWPVRSSAVSASDQVVVWIGGSSLPTGPDGVMAGVDWWWAPSGTLGNPFVLKRVKPDGSVEEPLAGLGGGGTPTGISYAFLDPAVQALLDLAGTAYQKPEGGIPVSDLSAGAVTGGGGSVSSVAGLALNGVVDDGPAIQAALDQVTAGGRPAEIVVSGNPNQTCLIDSTVQIESDWTTLRFDVPVVFGALGRVRIYGETIEIPANTKPLLKADRSAGSTVLPLNNVTYFQAGDYAAIRGLRDAHGAVLQREYFNITAVDADAKTITIDPPLQDDYAALNDTTWSNKFSQVTKVLSAALTAPSAAGDQVLTVLDSSIFEVGDVVQVIDDTNTTDATGEFETNNYLHRELAHVVATPSPTSVTVSHALYHGYDITKHARVAKIDAVVGSRIVNLHATWNTMPTAVINATEIRYGLHCSLVECHMVGSDAGSWTGHAQRMSDCYDSYITDCSAIDPQNVGPGRGYGATMYGATNCTIRGGLYTSCRHSVLFYFGASANLVTGVHSVAARISDFDTHGAECRYNIISDCTATGGNENTPDSSQRTAFKVGNPSHVFPGDEHNVIEGCKVVQYQGTAFEIIASGYSNTIRGCEVRGALFGLRINYVALAPERVATDNMVVGCDFWDVPTPFSLSGGPNSAIDGLSIVDNRWFRCGPFTLQNATRVRFEGNRVYDPTVSSTYAFTATASPGIRVKGNDFSTSWRGVKLTSCPGARVSENTLHDMRSGVVLNDNGGNTGMLYGGNRHFGYTPSILNSGTGPSSSSLITLADVYTLSGGGSTGGSSGYPPAGGVPEADLAPALQTKIANAYQLPGTGIPKSVLASTVQASLNKADTAYQKPVGGIPPSDLAGGSSGGSGGSTGTAYSGDLPSEHGYAEWNFEPSEAIGSAVAATAGRMELMRLRIRATGSRTKVAMSVSAAASGLTGAYVAVYDADGNQLAVSSDISSLLASTGVKSIAAPNLPAFNVTAGADIHIGLLQVGGTPASFHRAGTSAPLVNAGLNASLGYRFAYFGSGYSVPPTTITPSGATSSANSFWTAIG